MRAAAALGAGHFAHNHFAHDNFHNFRNFHRGYGYGGYGYGWYGPVFWPYAYDDIFDDILWGFGLGGPFGTINANFWPCNFNGLLPSL